MGSSWVKVCQMLPVVFTEGPVGPLSGTEAQ
jgi:hypothetical protein